MKTKEISEKTSEELVEELRRESGLLLSLEEGAENDDETRTKLTLLLDLLKSASDKNEVLMRYLTGQGSRDELARAFPRFFRAVSGENAGFSVYLVQTAPDAKASGSVFSVLSGLFPQPKNLLGEADDRTLVVVTSHSAEDNDNNSVASMISDTLSAEALTAVRVGYGKARSSVEELPRAFANARSALFIADAFSLEENCISYNKLGLSKLLSKIPADACREYLEEEFDGFDFSSLSSETMNTINSLFENGLNIAETARELYVHRNTLVYRIEKFEHDSGLDLRDFDDAVRCRMGMLLSKRCQKGE